MGSQLRRLRAKAGVTGRAHQKRQREAARRKERGLVRVVGSASGRSGLEVAVAGAGKLEPESKAEIEQAFVEAVEAAAPAEALPFVPFMPSLQEQRRLELAHVLGSHDGAEELADAITLAARSSPNSVDDVWEQALWELRRGALPTELSMLRKPEPPKQEWHVHRPGGRSRTLAALLALSMMAGLAVPPRRDR